MVEDIGAIGPVGGSGDPGSTVTLPPAAAVRPVKPDPQKRPPPQASPQPAPRPSAQQIQAELERANGQLAAGGRMLELNVDRATGLTIVTVKNSRTGAVLQQFPSSDSVHLAQMLAAWASGKNVLVDLIA
jgi:uncharacterized FlaG/YvyC family protein